MRPPSVDVDSGLAVVGATRGEIEELLGSLADDGDLFLTGSLATGLGNRGSDVDLNVFVDEHAAEGAPIALFLGSTVVDLQYFARNSPRALSAGLPREAITLDFGECAPGEVPDGLTLRRLSRWTTAAPFHPESTGPLLDPDDIDRVGRALVRHALNEVVLAMAQGELFTAAQAVGGVFWRKAGRGVVELLARSRGDQFIGEKWLWAQAQRMNLPADAIEQGERVRTSADMDALVDRVGLPHLHPADLVEVVTQPVEEFRISDRSFLLVGRRRLVEMAPPEPGSLRELIERLGPETLAEAVVERVVVLQPDVAAIDEALR